MQINIDNFTEAELIELNRRIVDRLRLMRQAQAQTAMLRFNLGDRVSFEPDARGPVCGILVRHNKKSVTVRTDDGMQWRVSPGLLRPVMDVQSEHLANVVTLPHKAGHET